MSLNSILATAPLTSTNYHLKMIGTSIGNSLIWDNGTNVGIGNTNTSYTLDVSGSTRTSSTQPSLLINYTDATSYANLIFTESGTNKGIIQYIGSTFSTTSRRNNLEIVNAANADMTLWTNNTNRMTIASTGDVGIGAAPTSFGSSYTVLDVYNATVGGYILARSPNVTGQISVDNNTAMYVQTRTNHPIAFVTNNAEKMRLTSAGLVGIGTTAPIGPLDIAFPVADGATISATNAQTAYNYSRLRIKHYSASNLGLSIGYAGANYTYIQACYNEGTAAPLLLNPFSGNVTINNAITNAQLSVGNSGGNWGIMVQDFVANGALMKFHSSDGTSVGSITYNGAVIVYSTTSDYRLKEDLKEINGLEKISAIKVYDLKFKNSGKRMDGVIAHELQEVIPYAVYGEKNALNEDGTIHAQGVDYSLLTPILIKAVQEQQVLITSLQSQINELKIK
jgi:hypothetical protein